MKQSHVRLREANQGRGDLAPPDHQKVMFATWRDGVGLSRTRTAPLVANYLATHKVTRLDPAPYKGHQRKRAGFVADRKSISPIGQAAPAQRACVVYAEQDNRLF